MDIHQQSPLPSGEASARPPLRHRIKRALPTLLILLAAPLVALTLTAFVFQSYEVDGPSMQATLNNNDRLIVLKLGKTWSRIRGRSYIPNRGEIIIFNRPPAVGPSSVDSSGRQLIKRVIALPGERVVINNGTVTVFNAAAPSGFKPDDLMGEYIIGPTSGAVDLTVPSDEVFVLGDNRENSLDSRTFGTVDSKYIVGELVLRIFPFNKAQRF